MDMNLEKGDLSSTGSELEPEKKSRISYSRDFLLSLSSLDACKKLPNGFDASILSEFEDAFNDTNDERHRTGGGLPFQSSRYNDYNSVPRYKTEASGDYARGSSGRWEPRSFVSNNKDGDSDQGESGRRYGNQSRRSWQPPEHDGLLGSGAFTRTSGHLGPSAPRARAAGQFQLNRSSEPYQPPRPYKAVPFQRKENNDSRNDETFGSSECSSEDRAEEERKRRASFELLRKEQHKQFDRQKQIPENDGGKLDTDIVALLEMSVDQSNKMQKHEKAEDHPVLSQNDNPRSTTVAQAPVSRPLVPPGFAGTIQDKSPCFQSSSPHMVPEAKLATIDKLSLDANNNEHEKSNQFVPSLSGSKISLILNDSENFGTRSSDLEVLTHVSENFDSKDAFLQKNNDVWRETTSIDVRSKREEKSGVIDSFNRDSSSILEKLFGSASSKSFGRPPTHPENEALNIDEGTWNPATSESSKFARWFSEEEKKPEGDFSSKDLLSLIVNSEQTVPPPLEFSSDKAVDHIISTFNSELTLTAQNFLVPSSNSSMVQAPSVYPQVNKPDSSPNVLTCEDLEQFILAEVKDNASSLENSVQQTLTSPDKKSEEQKVDIDDGASLHILNLLQKGTTEKDKSMLPISVRLDTGPFDKLSADYANHSFNVGTEKASHGFPEASSMQTTLTLEALFGAAFMNELQSAEAPVSAKRLSDDGSSTSNVQHVTSITEIPQYEASNIDTLQSHVSSFLYADNSSSTTNVDHAKDMVAHYAPGPEISNGSSVISGPMVGNTGFEVGASEVHLPEEDSLITGIPHQLAHLRNQPRVPFPDWDQRNRQMEFINPEGIHHDPHLTFPANLIRPNAFSHFGGPHYDPHNFMLPRMPIPGNFPPQIPVQGLTRGIPASHPINQRQSYMPELGDMHHIPLHQQQPNYGGMGMGVPGPIGGGINHPEELQRLLGMELRANQVHPAAAGHFPGIYGPDLEPNFRYR